MSTNLIVCCPRCPGSTWPYSLDELREHAAKKHLEMPSLFSCPQCEVGFISSQQALHHFYTTCSIQKQYLTMGFMKNLPSMDSSFFKELFVIETEAIRNLLSTGSVVVSLSPASIPLVKDREKDRPQKKSRTESREKNSPKLADKKPKAEPCNSPASIITLSTSQRDDCRLKNCHVSSRSSAKRVDHSDTGSAKKQKTEKVNRGRDHACEYEDCCHPTIRRVCNFCNGFHTSMDCSTIVDFEERKMLLQNKGICTTCGLKHLTRDEPCGPFKCRFCDFYHKEWFFCPSDRYRSRLDYLKGRRKLSPTLEILKFQVERSAIFDRERQREIRRLEDEKLLPTRFAV